MNNRLTVNSRISKWTLFTVRPGCRPNRGMTLVELLVVLIILGLLATMASIRFATPLREQRVHSVAQQWFSLDFASRKMSRNSDVIVRIQPELTKTLVTIDRDGQIQRSWAIPKPTLISVTSSSSQPLEMIHFNRGQGSDDYRISVRDGTALTEWEIAGGTGKVRHVTR